MHSTAETGRRLEQQIAEFFTAHGYDSRCNTVLEGRSGGRHEIDVLAEKSDALTTFRVVVECKAWQQPIEKDVVSKLHYVVGDLGLSKGIVVSLGGCRSGAERTAADLGIELWGPDELRRHLGEAAAAQLSVPASPPSSVTWGYRPAVAPGVAQQHIRSSGKGRFHLRTLEEMQWFSLLWVPAYCIRLTVAQPTVKRFKTQLQSTSVDNLYEALGGSYLGHVPRGWEETEFDPRLALAPTLRDSKLHATFRKAMQSYEKVTSQAAVQRHAADLRGHGIPVPCSSLAIDATSLVRLPYWTGILGSGQQQRVVAVDACTGSLSPVMSSVLTANLSLIRSHFTP